MHKPFNKSKDLKPPDNRKTYNRIRFEAFKDLPSRCRTRWIFCSRKSTGVTRSTISNHMANLESRMGLTLCLRGRGGFTLTEDGQAVYQGLSVLLESLNDFSLLINSLNKELSGELVILCADQLDKVKQKRLAHVIELVSQQAPNLHIVLENDTIVNIEKQLMQNKAHIGIFPGYQKVEGLIYQSLTEEPNVFVLRPKTHLILKEQGY